MKRATTWTACSLLGFASLAGAQDRRFEISGNVGYTASDGVTGDGVRALDGNVYNSIDPKESVSFNFTVGYFVSPNVEIEFLWDRQPTTLEVGGTRTVEIGDMNIDNYHGLISYHFGESDATTRPFISIGAGATSSGDVEFTGVGGQARTIPGNTRFSGTLGAGLKVYRNNVGLRLGVRWTPTYIKSDAEGWWCDPYWGCYVVGDAQYMNQFQATAGIVLRF